MTGRFPSVMRGFDSFTYERFFEIYQVCLFKGLPFILGCTSCETNSPVAGDFKHAAHVTLL